MGEYDVIQRYFKELTLNERGAGGLLDDAACLNTPMGQEIVISSDSSLANVHFPSNASMDDIAYRALAVNLSDLAAMGAQPWTYTLSLSAKKTFFCEQYLNPFCRGLAQAQKDYQCFLSGGDTTVHNGELGIHITIIGLVPKNQALHRYTANVGDDIYVSGIIGNGGKGLKLWQNGDTTNPSARHYIRPTPRIALGLSLHNIATACTDISDGLIGDAEQLCRASGVSGIINIDKIPVTPNFPWQQSVTGGDDYELLFTAPPTMRQRIMQLSQNINLSLTRIGYTKTIQRNHITITRKGIEVILPSLSFQHI